MTTSDSSSGNAASGQSVDNSPDLSITDTTAGANRFWSLVDDRIQNQIESYTNAKFGQPRSRYMTLNVPLADLSGPPAVGWLTSVVINTTCRIVGWQILALTPGQIVMDIQLTGIDPDPSVIPVPISMPGNPTLFPALNGYGVISQDTSLWVTNIVPARTVLLFYVVSAAAITSAVLGLSLQDMDSKTLQT